MVGRRPLGRHGCSHPVCEDPLFTGVGGLTVLLESPRHRVGAPGLATDSFAPGPGDHVDDVAARWVPPSDMPGVRPVDRLLRTWIEEAVFHVDPAHLGSTLGPSQPSLARKRRNLRHRRVCGDRTFASHMLTALSPRGRSESSHNIPCVARVAGASFGTRCPDCLIATSTPRRITPLFIAIYGLFTPRGPRRAYGRTGFSET
jgi:hypothetical protein